MEALLPPSQSAIRCAPYTATMGFDPVGTAVRADQIFLVELPLPWPKPVRDHPQLAGMMDLVDSLAVPSRLFAAVPAGSGRRLIRFRRWGATVTRSVHAVEGDLATRVTTLGTLPEPGPHDLPAGPSVLVCVQGSHDVCCGSDGERFATSVASSFPDVTLHRVSHTGGHRFAPTGMTIPDGRMWARMDLALVDAVVERRDAGHLADRCRGWWGADRGFAQAAERAVFADVGWSLDASDRRVDVTLRQGDAATCTVRAGATSWRVAVEIGREVPTISCRMPGGLPAEATPEYRVSMLQRIT